MDAAFWKSRWDEGRIGFHEGAVNAHLAAHADVLGEVGHVLVPLCGKAEDLAWLAARGHRVLGVELSELAATAFFAEHGWQATPRRIGSLPALSAHNVTIIVGDFFAVERAAVDAELGPLTAWYNRAALIALPSAMRTRYVAQLHALLPPAARGLLVTLKYDQAAMDGPPFSVDLAEVQRHWGDAVVRQLAIAPTSAPRLRELGLSASERVFELRPPPAQGH